MLNLSPIFQRLLRRIWVAAVALVLEYTVAIAGPNEEEAEFGEKVRTYLLENPEIILEVMDLLAAQQEERTTRDLIAPYVPALFEMDLRIGPSDVSRGIIKFFDYNCAVGKADDPVMQTFIAANPDVAIVKKHLPILSPGSERAVRFVLATRRVYDGDAYTALHEAIYARMGLCIWAG